MGLETRRKKIEGLDNRAINEAEKNIEKNSLYDNKQKDDLSNRESLGFFKESEDRLQELLNELIKEEGVYHNKQNDNIMDNLSAEEIKASLKNSQDELLEIINKLEEKEKNDELQDIHEDLNEKNKQKDEEVENVNQMNAVKQQEKKIVQKNVHSKQAVINDENIANTNNSNSKIDEINFIDINRRSNDFSNLDELQKLDIADENFEQQKEEIIDAELIKLGEICDELIKMKEKIDDEGKRLDNLKENLPKEIEDAIARENEIQQELNILEEEFANLSEEDPQYEEKKTELEGKRDELKEASFSLTSLKNQQENLKSEYEKLNEKKLEYKDAKEVYDNRTEISFDVIFKFEPEKAKQINDMETPEEIDTLEEQNEQIQEYVNKPKWHENLSQDQIDELNAEGIEPGDPEYYQYLANIGIKVHDNNEIVEKANEQPQVDDKQQTNINLTPEQFEELLSRINNQEQQVQTQEIQNEDIQNNVIESQENNEIAEEQTALTDPSKENKFKVFFRNFKEKVKNIVRKVTGRNISDTRAEEIASEEITQNDDFGDSLRSSVRNEEEIIQEQIQREANQIRNMDSQQIENILE